ncbi:CvpA family protein [Winogradskyella aurantiaca]|uniref:CvpA family protein n=1 Tax=Winogradskyella aurantiaca TaxID=2219558 RepID=UPI000E1CD1D1|nr:CvpA family protein [Winogradskyella aurantiaca]
MSVIDIVLGSLLIIGTIRGLTKGLFVEVASLLALVLGIFGAVHFSNYASEFIYPHVEWDEKTLQIISFAVTFVAIVMAIGLAGKALTKLADFAALGLLNKLLGALFGFVKIALILSIVLLIIEKVNANIPFLTPKELKKSALYVPVKSLAPSIFPSFKDIDIDLSKVSDDI